MQFNTSFGVDLLAFPHHEPSGFEQVPAELEQLLSLIDHHASTEHKWIDLEIVDQILAEKEG